MSSMTEVGDAEPTQEQVRVWDPLVRIFHWGLVAAFAIAYITGDEWEDVHYVAGYTIMGLVAFRIIWGLVGPRHARFWSFIYHPSTVISFLKDSVAMKAKRYIGHNPAGGAMVITLLLLLVFQTATGYAMLLEQFDKYEWIEDVHGVSANILLALVILHVLGVVLASFEHKENLARSMVTGRKRAE